MNRPTQPNINDEHQVRLARLQAIQAQGITPYPARVTRTHTVVDALDAPHESTVTVAGRLFVIRDVGKITFATLRDKTGTIQVVLQEGHTDQALHARFRDLFDAGDIVSVTGHRIQTKTGEESVLVTDIVLLSKSLRPLPDKFHGLADEETRARKRYLDLLVNPEERDRLVARARIITEIRSFLHNEGFMEVETPMLETVASGAMAKTFDTYLNAYDLPVHLRIAVGELWQKRLLVGGLEKIFELGKAFRNEGVSFQHNPEFTMLEFYWAYADMFQNIELHERLIPHLVQSVTGSLQITYGDIDLDFTAPYPRVTFHDIVLEHSGIDIDAHHTVDSLRHAMETAGYSTDNLTERGKLIDHLYKQAVRPHIVQPTFVMNYPVELKPLAKRAEDPRYTEMFQLLINGSEISNSYTELNDPIDQRERFLEQAKNKAAGDDEAMGNDWDYVEALEYGMPPATGTGIGIDRLAMLLTDAPSIRNVIAFPTTRPIQPTGAKKRSAVAHAVLFDNPALAQWQRMNAIGHLGAALGARLGKQLFGNESSRTLDDVAVPMNIGHALVVRYATSQEQLHELVNAAREKGLVVELFTEAMQQTTNDAKVIAAHQSATFDSLNLYGVLVFGERSEVEPLTDQFPLAA